MRVAALTTAAAWVDVSFFPDWALASLMIELSVEQAFVWSPALA
jgi:hypothetical protein